MCEFSLIISFTLMAVKGSFFYTDFLDCTDLGSLGTSLDCLCMFLSDFE